MQNVNDKFQKWSQLMKSSQNIFFDKFTVKKSKSCDDLMYVHTYLDIKSRQYVGVKLGVVGELHHFGQNGSSCGCNCIRMIC